MEVDLPDIMLLRVDVGVVAVREQRSRQIILTRSRVRSWSCIRRSISLRGGVIALSSSGVALWGFWSLGFLFFSSIDADVMHY